MAADTQIQWVSGIPRYFRNSTDDDFIEFEDFMQALCDLCNQYNSFVCLYHAKNVKELYLTSRWNKGIFFAQNWNPQGGKDFMDLGFLQDHILSESQIYIQRMFTLKVNWNSTGNKFAISNIKTTG